MRGVILDEAVTDLFSAKVAFELRDAAGEGLNHEASGGGHFYGNPKLFKSKRVFFFFFKREGCLRGGRPQHGAGGRVTEDTWHVPRTPWEVAGRVGRRLAALIRSFVDFHQLPKLRI